MSNSYKTVSGIGIAEMTEKGSRFVGYCYPVSAEPAVEDVLAEKRKAQRDASHHVFAYILRSGQIRCSDSGEPSGSAGSPVLHMLQQEGIEDCLIVVARWFGGTLLGMGGLIRAYSRTAKEALLAAGPVAIRLCLDVELSCDYAAYGWVLPLIVAGGGTVDDTVFAEEVKIQFHLKEEAFNDLRMALTEKSAGKFKFNEIGRKWRQA